MKKLLLLIFTYIAVDSKAQTWVYHPFPESDAIWVGHYFPGLLPCHESYSYLINGDSIINSHSYKKLYIPYVDSLGPCVANHTTGYSGGFRQDTTQRKVYYIAPGNVMEELLYDFSLQVGDTILGFSRLGCYQIADTITGIDSILIGSNYRKFWHFGSFPNNNSIIEGIGFISGLLEGCATSMPDGPFYMLDCFQQNGLTLYPNTSSGCQLITNLNSIANEPLSISIVPNPIYSNTTITFNKEQNNSLIKITDIVGKEIKTINFTGKQLVINKGEMKAGIYFVQTSDEKKNIANKKIIVQ